MTRRLTASNLRQERAKHLARRKAIQNPPNFVIGKPSILHSDIPSDSHFNSVSQFKEWQQANASKTKRKVGLYVQPYRPPSYLVTKTFDPEKSRSSRSAPSRSSVFPIPQQAVEQILKTKPSTANSQKEPTSTALWKPILFTPPFPNSTAHNPGFKSSSTPPDTIPIDDPPTVPESISTFDKPISKAKTKKGKKLRTKWHCSICGLRHLSSEKQLLDHQGSFRCQARQNRDNPWRCRKCGKKCDNAVNYHRHKEARCYKNNSK